MKRVVIAASMLCLLAILAILIPASSQPAPPDLGKDKTLYIVSTAHLDTQWRWTIQDTINRALPDTFTKQFAHFEKSPDYTFSFEGAFRYMLIKEYYPQAWEKLKDYVAKGRWRVAGSSIDAGDANMPSPESLMRQCLYGNGFFRREFGKTSADIFLPDCFGFGYALPSVAAHCGLKGFSTQKLGWGCWVGAPLDIGVWEGVDGSRLVAAMQPGDYNSGLGGDLSKDNGWKDRIERLGAKSGVYAGYKYIGVGDSGGAPGAGTVDWLEKAATASGPFRVVSAPSDQLCRDVPPEQMAKLPLYKGELLMTTHGTGCYTSQTAMKRWNRKNELLADAAERAAVAADLLGGCPYPKEQLAQTWVRFLWHQFHDDLTGTSIPPAYEFSWNDEIIALNRFASVLEVSAGSVARALDTRAAVAALVVYNPLSVAREDVVDASVRFPGGVPKAVRVFDPEGQEVPAQLGETRGEKTRVVFLASVPPVSFSVFDVRPSDKECTLATGLKVSTKTIDNPRYLVTFDATGDVASIKDKKLAKELLDGPLRLQLLPDGGGSWPQWEVRFGEMKSPPIGHIEGDLQIKIIEAGPARAALEVTRRPPNVEGLGSSSFVQRWRLAVGGAADRLECDAYIEWDGKRRLLKAAFPLAASNPQATYDLGLGAVQRGNNQPRLYEVPAQQWADLTAADGSMGVAVLNDCKYGWDKPQDNTLRLTLLHSPRGPWGDGQDKGRHKVLYALYGHQGNWAAGGVPWQGARLNQPLVAFQSPGHDGKLGKRFSLLAVSTPQVAVRAVKQAEDSDEVVVRLQELEGKAAEGVTLSLFAPIASAREANGAEEAMGEVPVKDGKLTVSLRAFQPRAFALKISTPAVKLTPPLSQPVNLPYDRSVTSSDGKPVQGSIDGRGRAIPAEIFPASVVFQGVTFKLGPAADGGKNALVCNGQTVSLPAGDFNRLYVLAAATEDAVKGSFVVDGKATEIPVAAITGFLGQWDRPKTPGYIKRDALGWFGTHCHDRQGKNEAYIFCYLFEYTFDLPRGARAVKLPEGGKILLFAATAANDPNAETRPAQLLYDEIESLVMQPHLAPAAGAYDNQLDVTLTRPLYLDDCLIRYTTDGGEPSADSRAYSERFTLGSSTVVRARLFRQKEPVGAEISADYRIEDRTPPTVTAVYATANPRNVVVIFSEPLDKATAENPANYTVDGDVKIQSASLGAESRSVVLGTSELQTGARHAMAVRNVRDASAAANAVAPDTKASFEFNAGLVLHLRFDEGKGNQVADSSGKAITGAIEGKAAWAQGKVGGALEFDGQSNMVVIADRAELNPTGGLTVAAWVKSSAPDNNRRIVQKSTPGGTPGADDQYRLLAGGLFHISNVVQAEGRGLPANEWHHVAGTYDGKFARVLLDGKVTCELPAEGRIPVTKGPLVVGAKCQGCSPGDCFKGLLDEVMIFNRGLQPAEVQYLMMVK